MKFSIITPTFNSATTLKDNLASVFKQTYLDYEHLLIDNLSSDETLKIAREFGNPHLQIFSEKDRGISDAFNKGVLKSTGDVILILNSDDYLLSEKVLEDVAQVFQDPKVDVVCGDLVFMDPEHGTNLRHPLLDDIRFSMPFNHPALFTRRQVFDKFGLFDLNLKYTMDYEWVARFYESDKKTQARHFYFKDYPLSVMRAGGASYTSEKKVLIEAEQILKQKNLFSPAAARRLRLRKFRVVTKGVLARLHLNIIVRAWRSLIWSKPRPQRLP
jgi:glycosyltransferase